MGALTGPVARDLPGNKKKIHGPGQDPQADSPADSLAAVHKDSRSEADSSDDETQGPTPDTHPPADSSRGSQKKRRMPGPEDPGSPKRSATVQDRARLHTGNLVEPDDTLMDDSFDPSPNIDSLPLSRQSSGGASQ